MDASATTPPPLALLFFVCDHWPWLVRWCASPVSRLVWHLSPGTRRTMQQNARKIFGDDRSAEPYGVGVLREFAAFLVHMRRSESQSLEELQSRILSDSGAEAYHKLRESTRRGAVLVTAHLGSFEVGLTALRRAEPKVHVVFKRDPSARFERQRANLRSKLGVIEAPIDNGFSALVSLKAALERDEVVVMQADHAMPGQRTATVPFLHGHLELPTGPVRLAQLTGAPIVPVFAIREGDGARLHLLPAIDPCAHDAVEQIAAAIAGFVAKYPTQWLVLHDAFAKERSC